MAARLLSWVAFYLPLPFSSRTSVHQKRQNVFKNALLWSSSDVVKLVVKLQYLSRRHRREKTVVIVHEGSCRVVTVYFLWSEALLWVLWVMKCQKQLECLQRPNWHRKNNHHCMMKRSVLMKETHSKWKQVQHSAEEFFSSYPADHLSVSTQWKGCDNLWIQIGFFLSARQLCEVTYLPWQILLACSVGKNGRRKACKWKVYFFIIFAWPVSQNIMSIVAAVGMHRKSCLYLACFF